MANGHSGKHVDSGTRARAIELVKKQGLTIAQVSKRLNVSASSIRKWLKPEGKNRG